MKKSFLAFCLVSSLFVGGCNLFKSDKSPTSSSSSSQPTAICKDGTFSYSQNRSGTCSGHGGVKTWLNTVIEEGK